MTDADDTPRAKAALRASLRTNRRTLAAHAPEAAIRAAGYLAQAWAAQPFGPIATVAVYRAMGSELDPQPLERVWAQTGCVVTLPVVVAAEAPLAFRLRSLALVPDLLGVRAPDVEAPDTEAGEARPDLVVAPLLAFDHRGARLGQGGGFYDRTLAALRQSGRVFALGLAYAGQEIDAVPTGPLDQRLDGVLTEAGLRLFRADA